MKKNFVFFLIAALLIIPIYIYYIKGDGEATADSEEIETQDSDANPIDRMRFAAHAGGEINGEKYTNSLEALDQNYHQGFRMFEIDVIKTSDDVLVCAHDWDSWKRFTGYEGDVPVTRDTFLQYKIKEDYTPITLAMLNTWLEAHPDARILTDKINDPIAVDSVITNKSQLLMKLITFKALEESREVGIDFAISENLINGLPVKNRLQKILDLGTKYAAISRRSVQKKSELLLQMKEAGIKTYAFHVNFDAGKDECYVFKNEMDYFYGFYADTWDFGDSPCEE